LGDIHDTLDIVGSEVDMIGPTNYDSSHLPMASSGEAVERQEELGDEDQAWAGNAHDHTKENSENHLMVTKGNSKDTL
jgi:hypothetical protein